MLRALPEVERAGALIARTIQAAQGGGVVPAGATAGPVLVGGQAVAA